LLVLYHTIRKIVQKEGFRSIYKGLSGTWLREGLYSSLRLSFYEPFKYLLGGTDKDHTPFYIMLIAGGLSGATSSAICNPTDVLKIRMQAWEGESKPLYWHAKQVYKAGKIRGFYNGVDATISRATVVNASQMPSYDFIKHKLINFEILDDNYICHFVSSLFAGIVLTCVSGPFDIARTRLMNQPLDAPLYRNMPHCIFKTAKN
jgi:solute carrier family 25 protein 14/30